MKESTSRSKLETDSQEERLQKWKEHFRDLLRKYSEIIDKPSEEIIHDQLDIKFGRFTVDEFNIFPKAIKSRKAASLG